MILLIRRGRDESAQGIVEVLAVGKRQFGEDARVGCLHEGLRRFRRLRARRRRGENEHRDYESRGQAVH
jgi:hypothetical protein